MMCTIRTATNCLMTNGTWCWCLKSITWLLCQRCSTWYCLQALCQNTKSLVVERVILCWALTVPMVTLTKMIRVWRWPFILFTWILAALLLIAAVVVMFLILVAIAAFISLLDLFWITPFVQGANFYWWKATRLVTCFKGFVCVCFWLTHG